MIYRFGDFELDRDRYQLLREGELVHVEPLALELLAYLIEHRDRLVPREELLSTLWANRFVSDAVLARCVHEARLSLGDDGDRQSFIKTVRGRGYGFSAVVEEVAEDRSPASASVEEEAWPARDPPRERPRSRPRSGSLLAFDRHLIAAEPEPELAPAETPPSGSALPAAKLALIASAGAGIAMALVAGALILRRLGSTPPTSSGPDAEQPLVRTVIQLDSPELLFPDYGTGHPVLALSPDASVLVFVVQHDGSTRIHLRRLGETSSTPLRGTEGGHAPFFSPDGRWIAFFAADKLKKIATDGGTPVVLCDVGTNPMGGSWGEDGRIVFATEAGVSLRRVDDTGGEAEVLLTGELKNGLLIWPQVIWGGRAILLTVWDVKSPDYWTLAVYLPETNELRTLLAGGGTFGRVVANEEHQSAYLTFARGSALQAVPLDAERLAVVGDPVPVLDGVRTEEWGAAQFSHSASGSLAYLPGGLTGRLGELAWIDLAGSVEPLRFPAEFFTNMRLSPDGRLLAVEIAEAKGEIWIYDLERRTRRRLAAEGDNRSPVWTRDGGELWFLSNRTGSWAFYRAPIDGSTAAQRIEVGEGVEPWWPTSISPDGRTLVYQADYPGAIMLLDVESGEARPFPASDAWGGEVSPDGRWIAYTTYASDRLEVEVQPFPDGGRIWTVSSGGNTPLWSPRGNRLYYYARGDRCMAVDLTTEPDLSPGAPRLLFRIAALDAGIVEYAVDPSEERFLVQLPLEDEDERSALHLILNWDAELRRRVPTGR